MELVLVVTFSGLIGLALRYLIPGRAMHGLFVMPATGIVAGSLGWAIAVWVGLDPTGIWAWVVALGLSAAAPIALGLVLPKRRQAADDALWAQLTSASTP
ncbi:MAG: hypothetical protein K9G09_04085 [Pontimonas sp.]|nr:hypothetical protein [Pontimonas sp.]